MPLYPAAPADLPAIADLINSAYRGDSARQGWAHEADYMEGQRTSAEMLAEDLRAEPEARLLTLRDAPEAELLGCVWLEPAGGAVVGGDAWYLGMLTVRPDLQDRRLGRTLLDGVEAAAREAGVRRIRMTVVHVRETLIAWYQRRGYRLTGETAPFPYHEPRVGQPRRDDLYFVVLEKGL